MMPMYVKPRPSMQMRVEIPVKQEPAHIGLAAIPNQTPVAAASGFKSPMIGRIHNIKSSCGACGRP
jgi:hypothetical protein